VQGCHFTPTAASWLDAGALPEKALIPVVRQHRQRMESMPCLVQLLGIVGEASP